ncbi:MAG TPA: hypothetical protein VNY05_03100 [Candidatus Acidoferrales bacterium]|nr:hypothetical protein [Candidatus Acidoferrales bacterium]
MLKRFILWDYQRETWQYDVMVGIILVFIFATPRSWFSDQPKLPKASNIAMLPSENGSSVFFVDSQFLAGTAENQRVAKLTQVLQTRMSNRRLKVIRVEPILDSEGDLQGYMAFARP